MPQTNELHSGVVTLIGVSIISGIVIYAYKRKVRN
ncbi:MAG: LPXTG cell wall anchor domain-containing protein [Enterococcus sp.]